MQLCMKPFRKHMDLSKSQGTIQKSHFRHNIDKNSAAATTAKLEKKGERKEQPHADAGNNKEACLVFRPNHS